MKLKDGYKKLIGTSYNGDASQVLLSNGGNLGYAISSTASTLVQRNANGQIESSLTDKAPFKISSAVVNTNLNADLLDGVHKEGLLTAFENINDTDHPQSIKLTVGDTTKYVQTAYSTNANLAGILGNSTNANYPLLFTSAVNTSTTNRAYQNIYTDTANSLYYNPSTNVLRTQNLHTAGYATFCDTVYLYADTGDSPHLIFQRGTLIDGMYDWELFVAGGTLVFRYNPSTSSSASWQDVLTMYPSMLTTPWGITAAKFIGNLNNTLTFAAGAFVAKTYNNSAAVTVNIPTHTSHLTNNSDFITSAAVDSKLANYLPLAGGKMTKDALISWGDATDSYNDMANWNFTTAGLRIMSSIVTTSNAPTQYATALHVKGRYGFQIAGQGGTATNFWIRNVDSSANNWNLILHNGNSHIKNGVITIGGTSITPLTAHQSLANYVTLNTAQTITGLKTFQSNSSTTGISLILKNNGWTGNMSTAMDFYNGSSYKVPNARIETKMVGSGSAGGTLIFYTQTKHASTNPNPNGLTERLRISDSGLTTITGALTVTGDCDFSAGTIKFDTINIPTTSGGTTYGVGTNGQVLKSNGTTVYWASDNNSDTWRPVMVNGTSVATSTTGTGTLNIVQGTGITVSGAVNSLTITNAGVRSVTIGTSTNADKLAVNTNGTTNYLTIPYATRSKQDIDGNDFKTTYLRKVSVANNTTNDFNTFENMTLTGRGDPKTGASLSNAPWSGSGPAGGYGVLTYLWSGYGTQMAWGYNSNRIYIRNKYYSGSAATWTSTWDSLALTSDIPTVTNYYWADQKISSSSNANTSPTVALLKATTGVQIGSTDDYGWYLSSSRISAGSTTARGVNVGSLLVSNAWADSSKVPTNGIYSKGNIQTAGGFIKSNSSDSYVLLGGGGHKALSDFAMSSDYVKKAGDTMTGRLTMTGGGIIVTTVTTSNYRVGVEFYKGTTQDATYSYDAQIGWHNTGGDGTGSICILPYATSTQPWMGSVGLFITKTELKYNGASVWHSGNDGSGSGLDADLLDGTHKTGLLTALSSSSATNLSITVGGTTKSITDLYARKLALSSTTITSTTNDTTAKWGPLGTSVHFYSTTGQLTNQPSQYGLLLNVTTNGPEVHQIWMTQASGNLYHRGGNSAGWLGSWKTILDSSNYKSVVGSGTYWKVNEQTTVGTGDIYLEMWRGANASWKMINNNGTLRFQCNYTSAAGSYYDALTVAYNTGNVWAKGSITSATGIHNSSTTLYLDSASTTTSIIFRHGTTEHMRIAQPNGYVGIGTSSPTARLHVAGESKFTDTMYVYADSTGNYTEGIRLYGTAKDSTWSIINFGCDPAATTGTHANQWLIGRDNSNRFVFRNNTTDQMYLTTTGLGIGVVPTQKLHVNGNAIATNFGVNSTAGSGQGISLYNGSGNVATYGIAFVTTSNWGTHGYVTGDWATYFTMSNTENRGWIFKRSGHSNVFSIDCDGHAYANGLVNAGRFYSRVATGTQPYACTSTTLNTNLNADLLDGLHWNSFARYYSSSFNTDPTAKDVTSTSITDFLTRLNYSGLFNNGLGACRGSWYYAGNTQYNTGVGTLEMAGTAVLNISASTGAGEHSKTLLFIEGPTGNLYSYVKQSDGYSAVWSRYAKTTDVGNGTVTIKQAGTTKGSFTMNQSGNTTIELTDNNTTYSFTNNNPTLSWGTKSTIGTVGGVALTVTMPANPNTNTHWTTRIYAGASGTAANAAATNPYLKVTDDNTYRNQVRFVGGGATTVSSDASGNITISSTNTTYSFAAKGSATQGIYLSGTNTFAAMTYSLGATVNAGTSGKLAYYSGANAISAYTSTVGSISKPIYLNEGVPTVCDGSFNGLSDQPVVLLAGTLYRNSAGTNTTWYFTGIKHRAISSTNPTISVSGGVARFYFTPATGYAFSIFAVNVNHQASGEATNYVGTEYETRSSGLYWFGAYASSQYIYIRAISQGNDHNDSTISFAGQWNSYDDGVTRIQIIAVGYAW